MMSEWLQHPASAGRCAEKCVVFPMTKKIASELKGRPVSDARGHQTWKWESKDEVDTGLVRALGEGLTIEEPNGPGSDKGSNPYEQIAAPLESSAKRRTLDDMRALSARIKRAKQWTRES
jgi:hypothetical protein